jgi:ubiquinone/menaquinone biosynthesis C-methylase UbiE
VSLPLPPLPDLDGDPKLSCARLYESEAARWLLGEDLHPGGAAATLRLAELAGLEAGARVADIACGPGASARLLASERGAEVVGVDLGDETIAVARARTESAGLAGRVSYLVGDAERLPLADGAFDAAWSECSLCTFPDKARAVAEMARVVRPGGVVAIADVVADLDALPAPLRSAAARVACVADAVTQERCLELLADAGCRPLAVERRDADLTAMIDRVEARLRVARMLVPAGPWRDEVREAVELARLARAEAERGTLGYALVAARRSG